MVDSLQRLCFQSQASKTVAFIGIPPRAGTHQAAESQMLCRAAMSLLLQAFQELAHHRMRGWLQRARGVTAREIQQSHATSKWDLSKSHQKPIFFLQNFLSIRSSLPWLTKMNKYQSSMISRQLLLAQNTYCSCHLETTNLQVQGPSKSAMVKTFNFSASVVWSHLHNDILKCLLWSLFLLQRV